MHTVFVGFLFSIAWVVLSCATVYLFEGSRPCQQLLEVYLSSFRIVLSLGLILGTTFVVYYSQDVIPATVEKVFTTSQLYSTDYFTNKKRFSSISRSVTFSSHFFAVGFLVFSLCSFPLDGLAESFVVIAACTEYALGVYVGRKLCYAGLMVFSLAGIAVDKNIFEDRGLDSVNEYVNIVSTLTIVFVYIHVSNYLNGPFEYGGFLGTNAKTLLILPAVIATPVLLIFNFYPRIVLRKLYSKSIDAELALLRRRLADENLSSFEIHTYLLQFQKMSRDEVRHSLRLTLADLPIGVTILVMLVESLAGR